MRQAEVDGVIEMRKCDTADNIADIFTKPLTGTLFARAEDSIMGIPTATVALPFRGPRYKDTADEIA